MRTTVIAIILASALAATIGTASALAQDEEEPPPVEQAEPFVPYQEAPPPDYQEQQNKRVRDACINTGTCSNNPASQGANSSRGGGSRDYYAAIAVSSATASNPQVYWGNDELANSQAQADQLALNRCRAHGGPACKVTVWGVDYLALAFGAGHHWGAGHGSTPRAANTMALSYCRTSGGTSCVIEPKASISPRD